MNNNGLNQIVESKETLKFPSQQKMLMSQSELAPKDRALPEMRDWCERQGDLVVLTTGNVLTCDPTSRSIQNCKIMMTNRGMQPGKVILASKELIEILLANSSPADNRELLDPSIVSVQQQRLRMMIRDAIHDQASDIHIEVRADFCRVRFRKHGELYLHAEWSSKVGRELAAVAFNRETDHAISHFNPMVPQSASMPMQIENGEVRLRLASMPAHGGFDMVMRLLSINDDRRYKLSELGYTTAQSFIIEKATQMPHGAVIIAGPTGSGKTTTLASCMDLINPHKKIYTIEDPVEKFIENATQVPVNTEKEDRDFAHLGKAALRMDPDVIVLGETRDPQTAQVLMRAAITGHLVFSTIHTNNATNIVTRLVDMGASAMMLGDTQLLNCLIYQRLIQKLCSHCATPASKVNDAIAVERWQNYFGNDFHRLKIRGTQCQHCKNTGVSGRTVIAEVIWVDDEGRKFIQQCDTLGWQIYLRQQGWSSYRDHALMLVREGVCDPRDAEKIIGDINSNFSESVFVY